MCNLPRTGETALGAVTAVTKLLIALHVLSAYPILLSVVATEIEEHIPAATAAAEHGPAPAFPRRLRAWAVRALVRVPLVGLTLLVAICTSTADRTPDLHQSRTPAS